MSGALALIAGFVGFTLLVYAVKGSTDTAWDGKIAPGPVIGQLLKGDWPYGNYHIVGSGRIAPGSTGGEKKRGSGQPV